MFTDLANYFGGQVQNVMILITMINAVIHIIFAGAIARDAGNIYKMGQKPALVSAPTWAFATLLGGVFVAAIYWFIHHSTLTRPISRNVNYESKD